MDCFINDDRCSDPSFERPVCNSSSVRLKIGHIAKSLNGRAQFYCTFGEHLYWLEISELFHGVLGIKSATGNIPLHKTLNLERYQFCT